MNSIVNFISSFFSTAHASTAATTTTTAAHHSSPYSTVIMLVVFFVIFYFLLIRPQSKRAKQQRELLASIGQGDEVITSGGMMGKVTAIEDSIVSLEIANGVVIKVQKGSISGTMPKGSIIK
jgi:preprotein translocase subunit YajC